MAGIIEAALDPAHFFDTEFSIDGAISYIKRYLDRDGYRVVMAGKRCRLETNTGLTVAAESVLPVRDPLSHEFIREQMEKCDRKILEGDYDGAITNARSLVEAVLFEIEGRLDAARPNYDGDLPKLYKRVQKLLNLDPEKSDIIESLKMVLRGLSSIVSGLAPMRNKMGDAHVRTYKPEKHHAKLAVNSAKNAYGLSDRYAGISAKNGARHRACRRCGFNLETIYHSTARLEDNRKKHVVRS